MDQGPQNKTYARLRTGLVACGIAVLLIMNGLRFFALYKEEMSPLVGLNITTSAATIIALAFLSTSLARGLRRDNVAHALEVEFGLQRTDKDRLTHASLQLADRIRSVEHRLSGVHSVSGLPTREALIDAMQTTNGEGLLGIIELGDFDRLSAIDIATADALIVEISGRIRRMVGDARTIAQVDRARFAIWYPNVQRSQATSEFDALCYALRDRVSLEGMALLPQIHSAACFDSTTDVAAAPFIARTIASLSSNPLPQAFPDPDMGSAKHSFLFEQDLREAVAKNQLELWLQPFVDASTQAVCGAEALLRWRHPDHGLVPPSNFIPVMEAIGLSEEIGLWTLDAGCKAARSWQFAGLAGIKIAVNLSAHQLDRPDIDALVRRTMQRNNLTPALLELELTETAAAIDPVKARLLFDKLRALGISISIDDFGAGYSSLSYLKKLKFDKLKIDREFVSHVDRQRDSQAICQSIIALGRGLGISVLAEGVERGEEYEWLRTHGCTLFQGYYFSKPLEAAAFPTFVLDRQHIAMLTDLSPAALQERLNKSIK